ncbi:MAG: GUN4 domain-containing protein, partial [Microcystaceae cyanobacterium]
PDEIELKSERRIDYNKLRNLLAAGKWKEADEETARVMLQAANREDEGWLRVEDLENFPCEDLRTINQLWLHYSKGKFGFSVQKEIYQNLGGKREYNEEVWEKFADTVGWRVKNGWPDYKDITFDLSAPRRHLPGGDLWKVGKWEDGRWMVSGGGVRVLLSHRDL